MDNKNKKWWKYLLIIPGCLLLDLVVFYIAMTIDSSFSSNGNGHPAPFITLLVLLLMAVITVIALIYVLFKIISIFINKGKKTDNPTITNKQKKKIWPCFIPLFIEIPISMIVILVSGHNEIESFYANPEHIGFAIPMNTFLIALLFLGVTIILGIICIIAASIRASKNKKLS